METHTTTTTPSNGQSALPGTDVEQVNVTPDIAQQWLALNRHNRSLRERQAALYAIDMQNGDWRWTGETIKFAADGSLLDGQHRLRAVVIADVTLPFLIVRGLDAEAQEDVDRGLPRKFYDVLKLRGEINSAELAALVRRVTAWENGYRRGLSRGAFTVAQMIRTLEAHPELRDFTRDGKRIAFGSDLTASIVAFAWWITARLDEEDAAFFFERFADGQSLVKGDPIYELRKAIRLMKENFRGSHSETYRLAVVFKAWNAYRDGETVGQLRWRAGGAKPEAFPEPR